MRGTTILGALAIVAALVLSACSALSDGAGSRGEGPLPDVPNVVGLYGNVARDAVQDAGFKTTFETDGGPVIKASNWIVSAQLPGPGETVAAGSTIVLHAVRPEAGRELRASRLVLDDLPNLPLWDGTTATATYMSGNEVCVDRYWGPNGLLDAAEGSAAGYVVVTFPSESIGKPQNGTCADYVSTGQDGAGTQEPQGEHDYECGTKIILDSAEFICAEDFDPWPFSVKDGILRCEEGFSPPYPVTFEDTEGNVYAVNGTARDKTDLPIVDAIWVDDPNIDGSKVDIGAIIQYGLALCP